MESTHAVLDIGRLCDGRGHRCKRVRAVRLILRRFLRVKLGCCRYQATFKYSAINVPVIMLAVVWLFGLVLLVTHQYRLRAEQRFLVSGELHVEADAEGTNIRSGHASCASLMKGSYETVNPRQFVWAFYLCFVAG